MTYKLDRTRSYASQQPPGADGFFYSQGHGDNYYAFDANGEQVGGPLWPEKVKAVAPPPPPEPEASPAPAHVAGTVDPISDWQDMPAVDPDQKFMAFKATCQKLVDAGAPIEDDKLPTGIGSKDKIVAWLDLIGKLAD